MMKEMSYELLKDNQKKQLDKNNKANMTLYNALLCKEYEEYEKFLISHEETIDSGFTRFNVIVTSLKSLNLDYSNKNHVRKFLRALPLKWRAKVMAIEEAKDLATLPFDELIGNLKAYEMFLASDGVASKPIKEKVMPIALKANVTRGQTNNDSVCQDISDEDEDEEEEFNSIVKNLWKFFKKGNRLTYVFKFSNVVAKDTFEGNALDPWIPALEQGEQRCRGSMYNGIYSSLLQRYQPSILRLRSRLFNLTKGGEGKQRAKAYGGEDKLLKLKTKKLTMHAS
ncbi:hypothetical protein Tco_1014892 [Tanacetum coccineum]